MIFQDTFVVCLSYLDLLLLYLFQRFKSAFGDIINLIHHQLVYSLADKQHRPVTLKLCKPISTSSTTS
jgi:hypothetical protein